MPTTLHPKTYLTSSTSGTCKLKREDDGFNGTAMGHRERTIISAALAIASKTTVSHFALGPDVSGDDLQEDMTVNMSVGTISKDKQAISEPNVLAAAIC